MKLDGLQLLFGADDGALEATQGDPVARPAPVQRPAGRLEQFAPKGLPQPQAKPLDGLDLLFGGEPAPASDAAPQPAPATQQPQEPSFWQAPITSTVRAIRGKQDPAYKDVPEYIATGDASGLRLGAAKLLGSGDEAYGDIIARDIGDKLVRRERDANGYEVMVYLDAQGNEKKAYVNSPGLGGEDVNRLLLGAVPYVVGGGAVNALAKGFGGLVRAGLQAGVAGGTSLATNVAEGELGSEQGVDKTRAAFAAAGGAAGEAVASGVNAFARHQLARSLVNTDGTLTAKGIEAAKAAGVDPADIQGDIARTFARTYAKSPDAARAGIDTATAEFGIPVTAGQRSKSIPKLLDEKAMRYGGHGEKARQIMTDFDRQQRGAIERAVLGSTEFGADGKPVASGIGMKLQPNRFNPKPEELGQGVREGIRSAKGGEKAVEKAAWENVSDLVAKPGAFDDLPDAIAGQLGTLRPSQEVTPTAWKMAQELDAYMSGKGLTEGAPSVLKQTPIRTVDEMRRVLGSMVKGTSNATDRAAAKAVYDGFNDWIDTAAGKAMLSGPPEAAAALRTARSVSKEIKGVLAPKAAGGKPSAGARILEGLDDVDSAEGILNKLLGSGTAPKDGTVTALKSLKTLLVDRPAARGAKNAARLNEAWNDIRLAYWLRTVTDKKGDVLATAEGLKNAIDRAFQNQKSVLRALYSPSELREMQRLKRALETAAWKDPNASGSATAGMTYMRQLITTIADAVGFNSRPARAALEYSGIGNAWSSAKAREAVSQQIRAVPRNRLLSPAGAYGGASQVAPDDQ